MMLFFFFLCVMLFKGHNSLIFCDILSAISMLFHNLYFHHLLFKIEECDIEKSDFYVFLWNNTFNRHVRDASIKCFVFFAVFLRHLRRELWAGLQGPYLDSRHTCHHVYDLYVRVLRHLEATSLSSMWKGMKLWQSFSRWYLQMKIKRELQNFL